MNFFTTTELQKRASEIARIETPSLILRRGKPESIIVPFFQGYDDFVESYMEAYEMAKNREKLSQGLRASEQSGISEFSI